MVFELYDSNKPDTNKDGQSVDATNTPVAVYLSLCICLSLIVCVVCMTIWLIGNNIYESTLPTNYCEATITKVWTESGFRTTFVKAELDNEQTAVVKNGLMVSIGDKVKVKEILDKDKDKILASNVIEVVNTDNGFKSDE